MAVLLALVFAATGLRMGGDNADTLATSGDARTGLVALERAGIGAGALQPHEVLVGGGASPARVAAAVRGVDGIHGAVAPEGSSWRRDGTALVDAFPVADSSSAAGAATLQRVREAAHAVGPDVRVGGQPAEEADFVDAVYGSFPLILALIAITTFVVLARAFRSLLLPVKAIVLNLLSIAAAWGVLVLVWQQGYGSEAIWGIGATGAISSWMPLMVFAFLFGLSMDYEVFILARMREEYDRTGSTEAAVVRGLGRHRAARDLRGADPVPGLRLDGVGAGHRREDRRHRPCGGILLDATVIRALIVPALVMVLGRWNWWLPSWPARLLRVEPSLPPRRPAEAAAGAVDAV